MDIRKLQRVVVDALEDVKAADIKVFNSTGLTQLFDRVIIASGTSNRQTKALASSVRDKVKAAGGHIVSIEGEDTGEWVLVDLGDAIVHVMQPAIRTYYNLEEIWGGKPVSMRSLDAAEGDGARSAASRQAADPQRATVARKSAAAAPRAAVDATAEFPAAPGTPPTKTAKAKTLTKETAAKKAAMGKTAMKKTATAKRPAKPGMAAGKAAPRKTPVRKSGASKASPASLRKA